jgi:hypothetical protein
VERFRISTRFIREELSGSKPVSRTNVADAFRDSRQPGLNAERGEFGSTSAVSNFGPATGGRPTRHFPTFQTSAPVYTGMALPQMASFSWVNRVMWASALRATVEGRGLSLQRRPATPRRVPRCEKRAGISSNSLRRYLAQILTTDWRLRWFLVLPSGFSAISNDYTPKPPRGITTQRFLERAIYFDHYVPAAWAAVFVR